ncbi:MAG: Tm-1-like ATP-binding domain-containing protein [Methylocystaceae bacterium]
MQSKIVILGTLDTKGREHQYIKDVLTHCEEPVVVINAGIKGLPYFTPDIASDEVARAGGMELAELVRRNDRNLAVEVMAKGAAQVVQELVNRGGVAGIISLGGRAGTTIGTSAMRMLPLGMPKVMVSAVASGDTQPYVEDTDITMMNLAADATGINQLSRQIMANAAFAVAGMVKGNYPEGIEYQKSTTKDLSYEINTSM